ncbi:MAG: UDP-2,3-diacylglucosamine diphosphatase [Gemmatimonadetes bacterium]|nr:UDP-2,3-diacylglucosamine diphosphatase [Gemmatimonadota bacterium]
MFRRMPSRPAYVASDQHLGVGPPEMEGAFLRWLEFAAEHAGTIVLNGDLFDFWFEWGAVIPRGHARVLGALRGIVDRGVSVHLFGGNHDWWGGSFLTDEIGVTLHPGAARMELAGRSALVAHGDGLGRGDLGYRVLRGILRSRPARWGFRWIHPDLGTKLARAVSRTDIREPAGGRADGQRLRSEQLERWARDRLLEDEGLDMVLLGHTHLPRMVEVAPGRFYLNSGDWLTHASYLVIETGSAPRLERWNSGLPKEG